MVTRAERFDDLVLEVATRLEERLGPQLDEVDFAVEDVPPSDPAAWEPGEVALGRFFPAERGSAARIVVYRRPIETRARDLHDLTDLVNDVVVEQVAAFVGVLPEELDEGYDDH
ncbi:MAG TPA: metallopeptidase family protein [Dermatophilaceae bacterium]|nr:metallopeptidase family protein [Dermatophilaceae bacterium]